MSLFILSCVLLLQGDHSNSAGALPDLPAFQEPGAKITSVDRRGNLWLDANPKGRRVLVRAIVVQQKAPLEEFMCLKGTKEHESVVSADVTPRSFHAALLAAGAKPGHPARFIPEFKPPTGDELDITVQWKEGDQIKNARAQDWIRDYSTKKSMQFPFVFAGSDEVENPTTKQKYYLGNEGDLISVANFVSSIIDVPMRSSASDSEHMFEAFTERIPAIDTEVVVILKVAEKPKVENKSSNGQAQPPSRP